jgi:predicted AlkP superfamily phosphohydrolase/phosphomutase
VGDAASAQHPPAEWVPPRVFIIGWDGGEPLLLDEMMAAGRLPNLNSLVHRGVYGPLATYYPTLSPAIWTTVVTGKGRQEHGIKHFWRKTRARDATVLYNSRDRSAATLWDILTAEQRPVDVVGWWATWPAETIAGTMVTDRFATNRMALVADVFQVEIEAIRGVDRGEALFSPLSDQALLEPCRAEPAAMHTKFLDRARVAAEAKELIHIPREYLTALTEVMAQDETAHCVTLTLLRRRVPDLLLSYYESTDAIGHLSWKFRFPDLYHEKFVQTGRVSTGPAPKELLFYEGAADEIYIRQDEMLGELLAFADERTTVVVLSDHGMEPWPGRPDNLYYVGDHHKAPPGFIAMAGAGILPGAEINAPSVYDITPTVLTLLGLPMALDMTGRVLTEVLVSPADGGPVAGTKVLTYPRGPRAALPEAGGTPGDDAILERLKALGYVED